MKININLEVSESNTVRQINLDDLDISIDKWDSMSADEKQEALQAYVFDLHDQPYWMVTGWGTKEN